MQTRFAQSWMEANRSSRIPCYTTPLLCSSPLPVLQFRNMTQMERAARLIKNSKLSRQVLTEDDLARAVWPAAVGRAIAAHTSRIKLVRATLVVEVEDGIWQQQLYRLNSQILDRLRKLTGSDSIQDLDFRIAIPRRQSQRVESQKAELWPTKTGSRD